MWIFLMYFIYVSISKELTFIRYVDNYIKAFYQPQNELVLFAKNHHEYTNKQICAILISNVNSNLKKKQKQDLLNTLEDVRKSEREKR
jgi:hypothetical protein